MKKNLPRILILDDVYGRKGKERRNFCLRLGIKDAEEESLVDEPIAEAVFFSGQVQKGGKIINDLEGTLKIVKEGWIEWPRWALILLDLHFDTGIPEDREPKNYFGLKILRELYEERNFKDIPVIILSAMERGQIEQIFADRGVFDFIDKTDMTGDVLEKMLFKHGLLGEEQVIGHSVSLLKCLREARKRAISGNENILILGETGTGKELLAEYIHQQSGRKGTFNSLFTQGVPETLIEDRLFGHIKGAFNGAKQDQAGAAELAEQGTLFIDEFGNIPSSIQPKLLRLLDKNTREIQRLGGQEWKKLDLLVVMATNKLDILSGNDFRGDLLFRVKTSNPIILPPLRERKEDIMMLAKFFVEKFEKEFEANPRSISEESKKLLISYDWPGNIRELEEVIRNAVYNYKGLKILSANHLDLREKINKEQIKAPIAKQQESKEISTETPINRDLDTLIEAIEDFNFDHLIKEQLKGKLPEIQKTYAQLIAKYLIASLKATLSYTSKKPEGEISYHPAVKLITNDFNMKATPAKRLVNSLLKISPGDIKDLIESEPILKELIELYGDDKLKSEIKNF